MSEFYGRLQGNRGEATRCGTKSSGITATAESWTSILTAEMEMDWADKDQHRAYIRLGGKYGHTIMSAGFDADGAYENFEDGRVGDALTVIEKAFAALDEAVKTVKAEKAAERVAA